MECIYIIRKKLEFEKNGITLLMLIMIGNMCNYIFQILMSRMMTSSDYGTLNTLLSLFTILSVSGGLFTSVSAQVTAHYGALAQGEEAYREIFMLFRYAVLLSLTVLLGGWLASSSLSKALQIEDSGLVVFTVLVVAVSGLYPTFNGVLQGLKHFVPYSVSGILASAVKLFAGVLFVWLGWRVYGVLMALLLSGLCVLAYNVWQVRLLKPVRAPAGQPMRKKSSFLRFFGGVFFVQLFSVMITNGDILLVKAFSDTAADVGIYSSGMVLGRIALYVTSAVVVVLFPMVAETDALDHDTRPLFGKAMVYGFGISLCIAAGINLFGKQIVTLMYGSRYLDVVPLLLPISVQVLALTLLNIEMNYVVALKRTSFYAVSLGLGILAIAVLVMNFHTSVTQIVFTMSMVFYVIFVVNLVPILCCNRRTA